MGLGYHAWLAKVAEYTKGSSKQVGWWVESWEMRDPFCPDGVLGSFLLDVWDTAGYAQNTCSQALEGLVVLEVTSNL